MFRHEAMSRVIARLILVSVLLMSVALSVRAEDTSIDVGGVSVDFATIPGWCLHSSKSKNITLEMLQALRSNQVYLAVFGDCKQAADALNSGVRVRDFGTLLVDRENLSADAGIGRDEIISAVEASLPNWDLATQWQSLREVIDKEMREPKVGEINVLAVIAKDSWSPYVAGIGMFKTGSESFYLLSVSSITVVKRRILMCTVYTDYTGKESIETALARVRLHLAHLVGKNP